MNLQDIKETKHFRQRHRLTDNVKTVYPPQTKFAFSKQNSFMHISQPVISAKM